LYGLDVGGKKQKPGGKAEKRNEWIFARSLRRYSGRSQKDSWKGDDAKNVIRRDTTRAREEKRDMVGDDGTQREIVEPGRDNQESRPETP